MLKVGDRVEYWYRMGRVGTIIGFKSSGKKVWLEGGSASAATSVIVKFDDGAEEAYPTGELRLAE